MIHVHASLRRRELVGLFQMLIWSLIVCRLDYCTARVSTIPLSWFQSVINTHRQNSCRVAITSVHRSPAFIGSERQIELYSSLPLWRTGVRTVPPSAHHLASQLRRVANMPSRRRLRSSSTQRLDLRSMRLAIVDEQAFPVAAAKVWSRTKNDPQINLH